MRPTLARRMIGEALTTQWLLTGQTVGEFLDCFLEGGDLEAGQGVDELVTAQAGEFRGLGLGESAEFIPFYRCGKAHLASEFRRFNTKG